MMDRVTACLVVICITLTGSTDLTAQDAPQNDLFESILEQESSQKLSPNEISEIVAIRNRLGGGTGLDLGNILDDLPFRQKENSVQYFEPIDERQSFKPVVTAEKLFWEMLDSSNTRLPFQTTISASASNSEIESLRSIARRLEELASDMEELNLFEGADGLRIQAANVRNQSRLQFRSARQQQSTIR